MPYTFDKVQTAKVERIAALLTEAYTLLGQVADLPMSETLTSCVDAAHESTAEALERARQLLAIVR